MALFILAFLCTQASAGQPPIHVPHHKQNLCLIGTIGYELKANQECIDTAAKCRARHGTWGGTISGRGRSPGCTLPTKDAGKACSGPGQCEGYCEASVSNAPYPANGSSRTVTCACSASSRMPKGTLAGFCTAQGAQWIQID